MLLMEFVKKIILGILNFLYVSSKNPDGIRVTCGVLIFL